MSVVAESRCRSQRPCKTTTSVFFLIIHERELLALVLSLFSLDGRQLAAASYAPNTKPWQPPAELHWCFPPKLSNPESL
jgi:hypothetical protein